MADSNIYKGSKAVVTGGTGYFGYKLGCALRDTGAEVVLFDIKELDHLSEGLTCLKGNICNKNDVETALKGAKFVFHSASYGMSGREQLNKDLIEKVNVEGTKNVLEACNTNSVPHLVYTSTYNVVFGHDEIRNGNESLPYLPMDQHTDHYSRTKSIAEQSILKANNTKLRDGNILRTTALRPAGIYGEGEQRHLPRIVSYIKKGLFAFTYGSKNSLVDFVHVDNLVSAHVLAGQALVGNMPKAAGQAYFISDGKPINNFEFFRPLVEGLGYMYPTINLPLSFIYIFAFLTELVHAVVGRYIYNFQPMLTRTEVHKTGVTHFFSINKARTELGYSPVDRDLMGVVKHFREQGHGKKVPKKQSSLKYFIINVLIGFAFAFVLMSWLPKVHT
ncbi:short-chain dehydrogenase/reductase family 42E member 1-like [Actinia tenebrosa]|uniref:Short-chain dehydrogenase/reductase family 42E member 1-like n=1 Tax=Actinia tenebrosa TaxID=6105 RepID=A0A6P8I897_ACTTE|nr:short-chain dehydrogenase/reductase family 42E member 1-like [Actinia tenebrosa]